MKVRIEFEENLTEDEVIIKCRHLDKTVQEVEQAISKITATISKLSFLKQDKEYYISLDEILFFETNENSIDAHTIDEVYKVKYRLYELEEILPCNFLRVSKSTILNLNQVLSINRNLTASNLVEFYKSHKQVYVSRYYYKYLRTRLAERRIYEK